MLDTVVFQSEKGAAFFTDEMILAKIHSENDSLISDKYYAKAFPTSILLNKQGEEIDRIVGFDSTDAFIQTLMDYTNGIGTLDALLAEVDEDDPTDREAFAVIADKYKYRGAFDEATHWLDNVIAAGEPTDSLSGEARMSKAYMLYKDKDFVGAHAAYKMIEDEFVATIHGQDALVWQGIMLRMNADTTAAVATFESYIEKYPDAEDSEYCRAQIEKLINPPEEADAS